MAMSHLRVIRGRCPHLSRSWPFQVGRCMSIMERYRKLRPTPTRQAEFWNAGQTDKVSRDDELKQKPVGPDELKAAQQLLTQMPPKRPSLFAREPVPAEAQFRSWEPPTQPKNPRSIKIAIAGPPNSGKSSMLNALLGNFVSAVSPMINTTKSDIRGVRTVGDAQLVFIDSPGMIPADSRRYCRPLVSAAWSGFYDCDVCLLVLDVVKRPNQDLINLLRTIAPIPGIGEKRMKEIVRKARESGGGPSWLPPTARERLLPESEDEVEDEAALNKEEDSEAATGDVDDESDHQSHTPTFRKGRPPVILILNKIDKLEEDRWLHAREDELLKHARFAKIFYTSAKKELGIETLLAHLLSIAVPRPWMFPPDMITTLSHVEQIEQVVNFHLYKWFNYDVPYRVEQQTVGWTPKLDGTLVIEHELIVQDSVVARMICGVRSQLIIRLREKAARRLAALWGLPVDLRIWVKPLKQRLSQQDLITGKYK
eukprot:gnl/MRDRNA2_/MRDRNA2_147321_c0_seq1.p1 gnl/MRDRNA2_/MRDRNA2_147321_c0~~gnl/MRDRNA2_/MRDRNA2_147321_c0_seq1.p1  ORF type:complete len:482 (-),score=81.93 gnl/MRDRNA2_/MRDRNA2_147321_c0_seq1:37-1482(-)